MTIAAKVNEMWINGEEMEDLFRQAKGIAAVVGHDVTLDINLGKEMYTVRPDGTVERDRSMEFSFEVGGTYYHKFYPSEKWVKFTCTERTGNHVTLKEVGGKKRVFSGEVDKAYPYGGFNEVLEIGVIHFPTYDLVDSIAAHNFLYEGVEE